MSGDSAEAAIAGDSQAVSVLLYILHSGSIFAHRILCVMQVRWGICQGWIHLGLAVSLGSPPLGSQSASLTCCHGWVQSKEVLLRQFPEMMEPGGVSPICRSVQLHPWQRRADATACITLGGAPALVRGSLQTHAPKSLFDGPCCTIHILIYGLWSRSAVLLIRAVADTGCRENYFAIIAFLHP